MKTGKNIFLLTLSMLFCSSIASEIDKKKVKIKQLNRTLSTLPSNSTIDDRQRIVQNALNTNCQLHPDELHYLTYIKQGSYKHCRLIDLDFNNPVAYGTPLLDSVENNNIIYTQYLLNQKANINNYLAEITNIPILHLEKGLPLLIFAKTIAMAQLLTRYGSQYNSLPRWTFDHIALCPKHNSELIPLYSEHANQLQVLDQRNMTPLVKLGQYLMIELDKSDFDKATLFITVAAVPVYHIMQQEPWPGSGYKEKNILQIIEHRLSYEKNNKICTSLRTLHTTIQKAVDARDMIRPLLKAKLQAANDLPSKVICAYYNHDYIADYQEREKKLETEKKNKQRNLHMPSDHDMDVMD